MENKITAYKFASHAPDLTPEVIEAEKTRLLDYTKTERWAGSSFFIDQAIRTGTVNYMGYRYDLRGVLKKYIVKTQDGCGCGRIYTAYAPAVKALRKYSGLMRRTKVAACPKGF